MITPTEVRKRLKEIRGCTYWEGSTVVDDEKAHSLEDELYLDVLKAIANMHVSKGHEAKQLARLALNTQRIGFRRWAA